MSRGSMKTGGCSLLGIGLALLLQVGIVILDGLVRLGVLVRRLDKRLTFALEDLLRARNRGVDERSHFETRSELVFETERVANCQLSLQ